MRATLDATNDAILVTDANERVIDFNEQFMQLWELPKELMECRQHRKLLEFNAKRFADPTAFLARVAEIYRTGQQVAELLYLADGRVIERTSKIRYIDQRPTGWVWSFRDVTEQKLSEELRFRLAAVVESSQDAIISKTLDGIIQTWNAGAERTFGYKASESELRVLADSIPQLARMADWVGHVFWYNRGWYEYTGTTPEENPGWNGEALHDPKLLSSVLERWQHSLATGEAFEMEFLLRGSDGRFRWFLTRVNPLCDDAGRVIRWFGTNTDVDHVKRTEEALREETRTLELLNKTGTIIGSTLELEELLRVVIDAATQLSGAQFGAFFTIRRTNKGTRSFSTRSRKPRARFCRDLVSREPHHCSDRRSEANIQYAAMISNPIRFTHRRGFTSACRRVSRR